MSIRKQSTRIPYQGTVLLIHAGEAPPGLIEEVEQVFRRQTALRLEQLDVAWNQSQPHLLAELAVMVAEVNPCVILVADEAARLAQRNWRPFYPAVPPATFDLLYSDKASAGHRELRLDDGSELEGWLDAGSWKGSPAFERFGVRDGQGVDGAPAALGTLGRLAPATVEVLLGYASVLPVHRRYGLIALRIGDRVFACNHRAVKGVDPETLVEASLAEFLYGTRSPIHNFELSTVLGACYGRSVLGLRLLQVADLTLEKMTARIEEINQTWRDRASVLPALFLGATGQMRAVLAAGELETMLRFPRAPLDVFLALLRRMDRARRPTVLVHYRRVPLGQTGHTDDAFPWRALNPWPSERIRRRLETRASIRIEADPRTRRLDIDARSYDWHRTFASSDRLLLAPGPAPLAGADASSSVLDLSDQEPAFAALFEDVTRKLLELVEAPAERYQALLIGGSAEAARESAVEGMGRLGKLMVLANGERGLELADLAARHHPAATQVVEMPAGTPLDPKLLGRALAGRRPSASFVLMVHHESGTGMLNDVEEIAQVCQEQSAFLFLDATESLGAHRVEAARLGITLCTGAPEVGLGSGPGVSFVLGDRHFFRRLQATSGPARYLDLPAHYKCAVESARMPYTPPLQPMVALSAALSRFIEQGSGTRPAMFARRAARLRRELVGAGLKLSMDPARMSSVLTPVTLPRGIEAQALRRSLLARGYVVGLYRPGRGEDGLMVAHAVDRPWPQLSRFVHALEDEIVALRRGARRSPESLAAGSPLVSE